MNEKLLQELCIEKYGFKLGTFRLECFYTHKSYNSDLSLEEAYSILEEVIS